MAQSSTAADVRRGCAGGRGHSETAAGPRPEEEEEEEEEEGDGFAIERRLDTAGAIGTERVTSFVFSLCLPIRRFSYLLFAQARGRPAR